MQTHLFQISRLVLENFRAFRGRHEIPLTGVPGDAVVVLHGGNGSGKSTALAAVELFFRGAAFLLDNPHPQGRTISWGSRHPPSDFVLSQLLDWPPGVREPMAIEVWFQAQGYRLLVRPNGVTALVTLQATLDGAPPDAGWFEVERAQVPELSTRLLTPLSPDAPAFVNIDTRRRSSGYPTVGSVADKDGLVSQNLLARLWDLRRSLDSRDKARWRAFTTLVQRFGSMKSRNIDLVPGQSYELHFEEPDKLVLPFERLSSGEQQVVMLAASVLTARAPIVAIQEPEISLASDSIALLRQVLGEQVSGESPLVHQLLLESHVPDFDGENVVRFTRSKDGSCSATRSAGKNREKRGELEAQAAGRGRGSGRARGFGDRGPSARTQPIARRGLVRVPLFEVPKQRPV